MQKEVDGLVFKPQAQHRKITPPKLQLGLAPAYAPSSAYLVPSLGAEIEYVRGSPDKFAGRDNTDHFGADMNLGGEGAQEIDTSMAFDRVFDTRFEGKDTEDHFGDGMNMHADNDTSMAFDRVYDSRFEEKDTEDHFGTGMLLAADAETEALDSARRKQLEDYNAAKQAYEAELASGEAAHMGHEQLDTADHFGTGMMMHEAVDDHLGTSHGHSSPTHDHFEGHGMTLAAEADDGNTFDRVFGTAYDGKPSMDHFIPGLMAIGPPGHSQGKDRKWYPVLSKQDMIPPHRPKFLHGAPPAPKPMKPISKAMKEHLDEIAFAKQKIAAAPASSGALRSPTKAAKAQLGSTKIAENAAKLGGIGASTLGPPKSPPKTEAKSKMNSDHIASELVSKFDQFTRRKEDHMRKLLWTFGSDPSFEARKNPNAKEITPQNFHRVCDRFGLECDESTAHEIFAKHNLPSGGCNLYEMSKGLSNAKDYKPRHESLIMPTPKPASPPDTYKLAKLTDNAWKAYGARTAPYAVTLPPV